MMTGSLSPSEISPELLASFQKVFGDFQERAAKLSAAYEAMQADFRKINLELDRKNSALERSLVRQEEMQTYLDSILQSMESGVIGVNVDGCITHFNRAAAETTGFGSGEVLEKPYLRFFSSKEDAEPELLAILHGRKPGSRHNERVIWHKDGHPVPVSYHQALLTDTSGKRIGAVEIFSDISKIKALEEEMQQTRTMAALGEMSATVAHEIRNPLGAMGMWTALLERDLDENDPRRMTLGKVIEGLARLNKIVSNLLVFTRPVKAEFRKVNLVKTVEEIIDFVRIEVERIDQQITVTDSIDADSLYILADPEKMGQVLLNLSLNAIQALTDGGVVTVSVQDGGRGYAIVSVEDNGKGIPENEIGKIFDPFYTTKENGTGLGLAIVKKYIESHSGYIDVKSTPSVGTSIKVFIPLLRE